MYLTAVLKKEFNSIGKRKRSMFFRIAIPGLALLIVFLSFKDHTTHSYSQGNILSAVGRQTFFVLSYILMLAGTFLAPGYTAPLISSEREGQTIEIMASTPIRYLDLILGKAASRVIFLMLLTLSGVPLMFVCLMFGGVSPTEIMLSSSMLMSNILICSGLGLLISSYSYSSGRAIASTYVFLVIAGMASLVLFRFTAITYGGSLPTSFASLSIGQAIAVAIVRLNPYLMLGFLASPFGVSASKSVAPWVISASGGLVFFVICLLLSATILKRTTYLRERSSMMRSLFGRSGSENPKGIYLWGKKPRGIGHNPVYWKECIESFLSNPSNRIRAFLIIFVPFFILYAVSLGTWENLWMFGRSRMYGGGEYEAVHMFFLIAEMAVIVFYVIGASANTFSKERGKKTLEALMSTNLESHKIWRGKFLGVCRKAIPLMIIPAFHLTLLCFHGMVGVSAPIIIILTAVAVLLFIISVGISFSVKAASRVSSVVGTLVVAFVIFVIIPALAWFISLSFGPSSSEESIETIISLSPWYWAIAPIFETDLEEFWGFGVGYVWFLAIYFIMTAVISYTTAKPLRERLTRAE